MLEFLDFGGFIFWRCSCCCGKFPVDGKKYKKYLTVMEEFVRLEVRDGRMSRLGRRVRIFLTLFKTYIEKVFIM